MEKKTGAELISEERKRQIEVEGWTSEHDKKVNAKGELNQAAIYYANVSMNKLSKEGDENHLTFYELLTEYFPKSWDERFAKPGGDRVKNLIKAGALIAAEIDRINI